MWRGELMPARQLKKKSKKRAPAQDDAKRAQSILTRLRKYRPGARIELDFTNPLELLVATILSAQCTDKRVNEVTRALFRKYRTAAHYAAADLQAFQEEIRPTGFFRNKAKAVIAAAQKLVAEFDGDVPRSMEEMLTLPGVARKTANVVLGNAYAIPTGIVVDTHVQRVARRLGLTKEKQAEKIEQDLMKLYPRKDWIEASTQLVLHGRYICTARNPACPECPVEKLCPKIGL
jgi:endonuclease-3